MREITDQNNSEYGHFLRSADLQVTVIIVELVTKNSNIL